MRRALPTLALIALLIASATPAVRAQQGDMKYFESFNGLQRVIARTWMAPLTYSTATASQTVEINDQGTPTVISESFSTPDATPEPQSGIGIFTVFIYLFDSDRHAATGFDRIDADTRETIRRDPRAPMTDDLPLDGIGDQAIGYTGDLEQEDVTVTYAFATVQGGPFVYQLFSMSANTNPGELMRDAATNLVRQPMNRMAELYDPAGGSRGGLWSKLDSVRPEMPAESTVTDLIVYPMPEEAPGETPEASLLPVIPELDPEDPASIAGLASIDHVLYVEPGDTTPAPGNSGVFRIDAWLLTFDTVDAASDAADGLNIALTEPLGTIRSQATSRASSNGMTVADMQSAGDIADPSLPAGKGIVIVRQENTTVAGVVVYAIEEDPRPVADEIADTLLTSGFPERGDTMVQGLVPVIEPEATATPAR